GTGRARVARRVCLARDADGALLPVPHAAAGFSVLGNVGGVGQLRARADAVLRPDPRVVGTLTPKRSGLGRFRRGFAAALRTIRPRRPTNDRSTPPVCGSRGLPARRFGPLADSD